MILIDKEKLEQWRISIDAFVINDVRKALSAGNLEVGLIIITLVGVDCLGGYFAGKPAERKHFEKFIKNYFPSSYKNFAGEIYELRNHLLHDYVIPRHFMLSGDNAENHLKTGKEKGGNGIPLIGFDRVSFAQDFLGAWDRYFSAVSNDANLYEKMLKRQGKRGFLIVRPFAFE